MAIWDFETQDENNAVTTLLGATRDTLGGVLGNVGSGLSTGLELLSRPNRAVRTALFDTRPNETPTDSLSRGLFTPTGADGGRMDTGASALQAQGMPTSQIWGPIDTRGVAGFGLDLVTDPLSLIPVGKIGGAVGRAGEIAQKARTASSLAPRGIESWIGLGVDDIVTRFTNKPSDAVATTRWMAEKLHAEPYFKMFDPSLIPEKSPVRMKAIAYGAAIENTDNTVEAMQGAFRGRSLDMADTLDQLYNLQRDKLRAVAPEAAKHFDRIYKNVDFENPKDVLYKVHQMDFVRNIVPDIKQLDMVAVEATKADIKLLQKQITNLDKLEQQVGVALTNGDVGENLLRRVGKIDPSYRTLLEDYYTSPNKAGLLDPRDALRDARNLMVQDIRLERQALEGAMLAPQGTTTVGTDLGFSYLPNMWFTDNQAKHIVKELKNRPPGFISGLSEVTGSMRTIQASADISAPMIQGLVTLFSKPEAFVQGVVKSLQRWRDPEVLAKYLAEPETQAILAEAKGLGVGASGADLFEGMATLMSRAQSTLPNPAKPVASIGKAAANLLKTSEGSFNTFGTVARVEWAKAVIDQYRQAGKIPEMVDMINHSTGIYMSRLAGVSPTQAAIESGVLFFAPRYTRSAVALVGDVLKGGPVAKETIDSLGTMLIAGVAGYMHFANLLGQKPMLDPKDSRFLSVDVDGNRVGIGTVWVSTARALGSIAADPGKAINPLEGMSNPIFRWWRGRSAPLTSYALDLINEETFVGTPLTSFSSKAIRTIALMTPMNLQGLLTDIGGGHVPGMDPLARTTPISLAAGGLGLRESPERPEDLYDRQAQSKFGKYFDDLDPVGQAQIRNTPEAKALPLPQGKQFADFRATTGIMGTYTNQLEEAAKMVKDGTMTKAGFRETEARISNTRDAQLELYPKKEGQKSTDPKEIIRQTYLSMFKPDPITGKVDYDQPETFLAAQSPEVKTYIDAKRNASLEFLGPEARTLMRELNQARAALQPYWEIQDTILKRHGLLDNYKDANPAEMAKLKASSRFKALESLWEKERRQMRDRNPTIDKYLVEWYGRTPIDEQRKSTPSWMRKISL